MGTEGRRCAIAGPISPPISSPSSRRASLTTRPPARRAPARSSARCWAWSMAAIAPPRRPPRRRRRPRPDGLANHLGPSSTLIVLDDCEHLLQAAWDLALSLLGRCPGLRLRATRRGALEIPGEAVFPVPPLAVPAPGARHAEAVRES